MGTEKIFAIGDIHGCLFELKDLIEKLPLDSDSKIIFLGDYIDRGPKSNQVLEYIIQLKNEYEVVTLLGNHEAMMLEFFKDPSSTLAGYFILNGGSATLASYVVNGSEYSIPDHHLQMIEKMQVYHETDDYFFVHAGVPNVKLSQLDMDEHLNDLLWIREGFLNSKFKWEKTIVHGHTPTPEVEITKKRINLDTGCVFNGFLSAMEMNSKEIYNVKAKGVIPHTFLKEDAFKSRMAKRFLGEIPVFVETENGYDEFRTVNYNEFGLLIVDGSGLRENVFEIGQVLKGKIGDLSKAQISFVGQVMRQQKRGKQIAYGIKMLEPLGRGFQL